MGLTKYKDFAPTCFDSKGGFLPDRQDWFVAPVSRNRDDGEPLTESNFETCLEILGGESETIEVHRFDHWGPGWFEIILVHPSKENALEEIAASLKNYPVLDEEDYSQREYDAILEAWDYLPLSEKISTVSDQGSSIFSARRSNPFDISGKGDWPYSLIER